VPYVLQTTFNAVFVIGTMFFSIFGDHCPSTAYALFFVSEALRKPMRQASDSAQQQSSRESSFLQETWRPSSKSTLAPREKSSPGVLERPHQE